MSIISIADSLKAVSLDTSVIDIIEANKDVWVSFGKKNSHVLRTILFKMFSEASMSKEAIFLVYFFHALIKDKDRIISAIDMMETSVKENPSVKEAYKFIKTKMVKYVRDEKSGKFASVHLPSTNPGLDILCYLLSLGKFNKKDMADKMEEIFQEIMGRNTMAQMKLNVDAQAINEEKVKTFWNKTVVLKDAEQRKKNNMPVGFQKTYYETSSSDEYVFITKRFTEAQVPNDGYSPDDVKNYIKAILTTDTLATPTVSPTADPSSFA
jgi:hypothetical protein